MHILVTGGAGFVGHHLVHHLHGQGHAVTVLDRPIVEEYVDEPLTVAKLNKYARISCVLPDTQHLWSSEAYLGPVDCIIHLAAEAHVERSCRPELSELVFNSNVAATAALLDAARGRNVLFYYFSTDEVFGPGRQAIETARYNPTNPYSASKAASEMLVNGWAKTFGERVVITNSSNIVGSRQTNDKLIPKTIDYLLSGRQFTIHGNGQQTRRWVHVDKVVREVAKLVTRTDHTPAVPARAAFLGTTLSVYEVVTFIAKCVTELTGQKPDIVCPGRDRASQDANYDLYSPYLQPLSTKREILQEIKSLVAARHSLLRP